MDAKRLIPCIALTLIVALGAAAEQRAEPMKATPPAAPVLWPAAELRWVSEPDHPEISAAVLWGDPRMGAHGMLQKWKVGTAFALHTHTFENRGVMIAGTLVVQPEGGAAVELGPGSYLLMPGAIRHTTRCKEGADCLFLAEQPGPSDIQMVAPPAK